MKVMLTPASNAVILIVDGQGGYISLTESGVDDCKCCTVGNSCEYLTQWRIREIGGKVDQINGGMATIDGTQLMMEFPQPWAVPHYNQPLPLSLSMVLEVQCKGEWKKIDEWVADVGTCGHTAGRWPAKGFVVYQPPEPCNCKRDLDGDCGNPPELCPTVAPGTQYYLPNASAYTFTAAVDGEWSNLKNWQDYGFASPARELPNSESVVVIDGVLSTIFPGGVAFVNTVLVTANGQIRIPFQAFHAEVLGIIGVGSEACGPGVLVMAGPEAAEFKGAGSIEAGAEVIGNAKFRETSHNDGTVTGAAEFYDTTVNSGTVTLDANFAGTSMNSGTGIVKGFGTFGGGSSNNGTVEGGGAFSGTATNSTTGIVKVAAIFVDSSTNRGTVEGTAQFTGGNTANYGTVEGVATFTAGGVNRGVCEVDATFSATSFNFAGGTVGGNATFTDFSVNLGAVAGNATFDSGGNSNNQGGGSIGGDAVFNGTSSNTGAVTGTATFNDDSNNNGTAGTIVCNTRGACIPT